MKTSVQQADSDYCFQECKRQMFWDNHLKNRKRVLQETRERHGCGCQRDLGLQQGQWQNIARDNDQNTLSCWEHSQQQVRQEGDKQSKWQENNTTISNAGGTLENNIIKRFERINFVENNQWSEGESLKDEKDTQKYCTGDSMEVEGAGIEERKVVQLPWQKEGECLERKGAGPQEQIQGLEEIGDFEEIQGADISRNQGIKQISKGAGAMNCSSNKDWNDYNSRDNNYDVDDDNDESQVLVATPNKKPQVLLLSSYLQLSPEWVMDVPLDLQGTKPEGMKGKQQQQKCLRFLVLTKIGKNNMDILNCSKQQNKINENEDDNYWILDCWMQESKGVCVISDVLKINGDQDCDDSENILNENDERLQWIKSHQQSAKHLDAKECLSKVTFKVVPELQRFLQATNEAIRISVTAKFPQENMQVPRLLAIMNKRKNKNKDSFSDNDSNDEESGEQNDRDKRNQCDDEGDLKGLLEDEKVIEGDCWIEQE